MRMRDLKTVSECLLGRDEISRILNRVHYTTEPYSVYD